MNDFDVPLSTIKNNREWKKNIHFGYWCLCYDTKCNNPSIRIVLKTSNDPGRLIITDPSTYLVGPNGMRMDN